ncbi:glycoprotein endo-alpha-1,2-mannosidase isoform X2 [Chanos chanos]|uniref:Glycoprotein endo-alpha-1,2-mannosidase n=1 Tax=Chanos chanos TaxID=29144 RepID=A0A6J2WCJ9_CHACN|nr:glycoprotein endo-alpha-1,2-mannosidase-like isoform X2 [Chanos chanos]
MARFRRKTCFAAITLTSFVFVITVILKYFTPEDNGFSNTFGLGFLPVIRKMDKDNIKVESESKKDSNAPKTMTKGTAEEKTKNLELVLQRLPEPNYNMHAFYYTWYGNPQFDGKYIHWDHPLLPHWDPKVASNYPNGRHSPPDDIGANFYPALGAYSSRDPSVIEAHMQQLRTASIAVSWYPPGKHDENGDSTDDILPLLLDVAHKYQVKVAFHIEPFKGRDDRSMFDSVKYIMEKYGKHPAFYKYERTPGDVLPLFYVYDSYLQSPDTWAKLLKKTEEGSIRNTPYDGIFVALLVEEKHKRDILAAGFDGVYTYFATNGFSYGSSQNNWPAIKAFCNEHNLIFIPSVGPGYVDTSIRPWNYRNTRNRINGKYYETSLRAALETKPPIISITSFNEWHEGTQIESAVPKTGSQGAYSDYLPLKPNFYLEITSRWAKKFEEEQEKWLQLTK